MSNLYTPIPNPASDIEEHVAPYPVSKPRRLSIPSSTSSIVATLSLLLNVALIIALWLSSRHVGGSYHEAVYSPVDVALDYSRTNFQSFYVKNRSVFDRPPSPEVDTAWENLYRYGGFRLTKEEAAKLPNKTSMPIHGESDGYLGALYITHELHCLDIIRRTLYTNYYNVTFDDGVIGYCLSGLRQSLMCSPDTSVIVWQWSDSWGRLMERTDIPHSCRNFTKIQDWVQARGVNVETLDFTITGT